jgi:DNA invertase Pin-like site-specific DNA recombinase
VKKRLQTTNPIVDQDREPYLIGYARVSMADQSPQLQIDALIAHGVPEDRIYFDRKSSSGVEREQFELMLKDAREGDVIVVWKLDRLGRNVRQVLDTFAELDRKGAKVRVLTQPGMDTTTVMGRLIVTIMAAVAEMERDLIRERTIAGLAAAKAKGRVGGRVSKWTDEQVLDAARLGTSKATKRLDMTKAGYLKRLAAAKERANAKPED